MFTKIGEETLFKFHLNDNWTKEDLYDHLNMEIISRLDENGNYLDYHKSLSKLYRTFYILIYGDYDKSIVTDEDPCLVCPNNHIYKKYHDYNQLLDQKEKVLVLKSHFHDFRSYDIHAAYYTNILSKQKKEDSDYNIELRADPWTIKTMLFSFIGLIYV